MILLLLALLTALQLFSMYRSHQMNEIIYDPTNPTYWPTKKWQVSSPEEQGVSSAELLKMIDFYHKKQQKNKEINIDSLTIIRNERLIADLYFNPLFPKDKKHIINSCTKSIMGILIGIAIDKGHIENIDVPVLDFFKDLNPKNIDKRLNTLKIKDLLTMRTGWHSQDSYLYQWTGLFKMQATENWAEHILKLPFEASPGSRFDYSNMASFLLSAILTKACATDTLSFAEEHLFNPLGIKDIFWEKSPKGIYMGFARMWLKPHDMAKLGLLYLQKGKWENAQVVSKSWVEESIKAHSFPKQYRYIYNENNKIDFAASGGNWVFSNLVRPFTDGYGYQWWLDKFGMFSAIGVGGQYIIVLPKERLIVVATSKLKGKDSFLPATLLKKFIIPAIKSNAPLPPDETAHQQITSFTAVSIPQNEIKSTVYFPAIAKEISGNTYSLDSAINLNPWQHNNIMLLFEPNADYAMFSYTIPINQTIKYRVGLNNQYRITNSNDRSHAAIGEWTSPNTFTISHEIIGYSSKGKWILTFSNNEIEVIEIGMTGKYHYPGKVKDD